jgi:hypothetical protein
MSFLSSCRRSRWGVVAAVAVGWAAAGAGVAAPAGELERGRLITFRVAPTEAWDDAAGPFDDQIAGGSVSLFRPGAFVPELVEPIGAPFLLPPGRWVWVAEADGWVSSFTSAIDIPDEVLRGEKALLVPVVPACRLGASDDPRWSRLERVDVVSLEEHAVYPLVPRHRRELWVPAGRYLAYAVAGGAVTGISAIESCEQHERKELAVPEPPARQRQSFLVSLRLPEAVEAGERERLLALLEDAIGAAARPPAAPAAAVWQGRAASLFFLDLPADRALALDVRHPLLRTAREPVEPLGGSVRELALGELRERRDYEVAIDYRPARAHREERLELRWCGRERDEAGDEILVSRCRRAVAEAPLRPGPQTYTFAGLDDGQYLLTAVVDDEWVAGLGRDVAPFLDPAHDLPAPVEAHRLEEMEVYGHLLRDGEAVPGTVRLMPWDEGAGIPVRSAATDRDLLYHLFYFARTLTPGQAQILPEPLRDRHPDELPGLYCCFALTACSDDGLCRPFNIHSTLTGGGRFDLPLPGEATVDFAVVDAGSGEPIAGARLLLAPGPAFHFRDGEVIWAEPLGMEPDSLRVGADGRARWAPPGPGIYPTTVVAEGYESRFERLEVAAGEELAVEVRLVPEAAADGAWLGFADGRPVVGAALLPFGEDGRFRFDCRTGTEADGRVPLVAGCEDATYVVVHPRAALATIPGGELAGRAGIEVRERPAFPLRLRLVDGDGRPLADVPVQVRLGDLTLNPNDLLAGAPALLPWQRTDSAGEIVLLGVDPGAPGLVEVAPWGEWEGDWTPVSSSDLELGRPLEIAASPTSRRR